MGLIYNLLLEFIQLGFGIYILLISFNLINTPIFLKAFPFKMFIVKFICVLYVVRRIFVIHVLFLEFSTGWNDAYKIKVKEECVKQSINEGMTAQSANETCDCFVLKVVEKVDYYKFAYGDSKDTLRAIFKKCKAESFR